MNKFLKIFFIVIGIIFLLIIVVPFSIGLLGSANPKKAIEYGKQSANKYSDLYVPVGYKVDELASWDQKTDIFVTKMTAENNEIILIQAQVNNVKCEGNNLVLGTTQVCAFDKGAVEALPNYKVYTWNKLGNSFQLNATDANLGEQEIQMIIESIKQ